MSARTEGRPGIPAVHPLTTRLTWTLAAASAISVANLYYNQPLLAIMARAFRESPAHMGMVATLTQVGYAVGLLAFTPLGDIVSKRLLIIILCLLVSAGLVGMASAPNLDVLEGFSFAVGLFTVVPQVLVPLAADLAPPERRGRVIGTVMGGLLFGVLAARIVSGAIGAWLGWRTVFFGASGTMILLAVAMRFTLPAVKSSHNKTYWQLLQFVFKLVREQPLLRQSSAIGAMMFGAFSVLWTVLAFRLSASPYHFDSAVVGLFGLVGIAGVFGAPIIGVIADKRGPYFMIGVGISIVFSAFVIMAVWSSILIALIAGVFLLDFGIQAAQISNQARIYGLVANARSSLNSVYMVSYFVGGALGSALGSLAYDVGGFAAACATALGFVAVAFLAHRVRKPMPFA